MAGVSNRFWTASCNEFKFYQNLLAASIAARGPQDAVQDGTPVVLGTVRPSAEEAEDTEVVGSPSLVEARGALQRALTQLVDRNGENYVSRSALKVFIKRLLPSFDEQALGCSNFSEFLKRFPELVSEIDNVSGGHVARVGLPPGPGAGGTRGGGAGGSRRRIGARLNHGLPRPPARERHHCQNAGPGMAPEPPHDPNPSRDRTMTQATPFLQQASVPVFKQMLGGLADVLSKAEAHAAARNIDPQVLLQSRLYPDMFALLRQVQVACDFAKGVSARLAGAEVPSVADDETSFSQLQTRIQSTLAFLDSLPAAGFETAGEREIVLRPGTPKERRFAGQAYLLSYGLPQFFFHVTTAYAILRHNGIELGKKDYMGAF